MCHWKKTLEIILSTAEDSYNFSRQDSFISPPLNFFSVLRIREIPLSIVYVSYKWGEGERGKIAAGIQNTHTTSRRKGKWQPTLKFIDKYRHGAEFNMFPTKDAFTRFNRLLNKREQNLVTTSRSKKMYFFRKKAIHSVGGAVFAPLLMGAAVFLIAAPSGDKERRRKKLEELIHQEKGKSGSFPFPHGRGPKKEKRQVFSQGRFTFLLFPEFRSDFYVSFVVSLKSCFFRRPGTLKICYLGIEDTCRFFLSFTRIQRKKQKTPDKDFTSFSRFLKQ